MRASIFKWNAFFKGFLIVIKPHIYLGWLQKPFYFISNLLAVSRWVAAQNSTEMCINDFYTPHRDIYKRYKLYEAVANKYALDSTQINYLEFGVRGGKSFEWWYTKNTNSYSRFVGFDTFEGLPEDWGLYKKGDMSAEVPQVADSRVSFVKGLFQDTLHNFLAQKSLSKEIKNVIHIDADLYSSTLFALSTLAPFLKSGDIILFDEFNVPNHEFLALKHFTESYYIKTKVIGAVNNYFQIAIMVQ